MKALSILLLLLTGTVLGFRILKNDRSPPNDAEKVAKSSNSFGLRFLKQLPPRENGLISPISISMLMGLLYSGANNFTAEEIKDVMNYPTSVHGAFRQILNVIKPEPLKTTPKGYDLEMANAILIDKSFNINESFKDQSRKYFEAAVETVSFDLDPDAAVESVNGWVAWRTRNKIRNVLDAPLDPLTLLFMMNAVYFKGTWGTKFNQRFTMPDTFYNEGLVPKTVPMMRQKGKLKYNFDTRHEVHVLEKPYEGEDIKMLVLLPMKRDGLPELEKVLCDKLLWELKSNLREVIVQVTLPRFKMDQNHDIIPILKQMGIDSLFNPELSNLSQISAKRGLYVTKALHKCAIDINEEGSEGMSVTGVSAGVRTGGPLYPVFNADHPFIFVIYDSRINLILFVGRVTNL